MTTAIRMFPSFQLIRVNMKKVIILAGPSGVGKSTFINELKSPSGIKTICSADHFFVNRDTGEYEFNPSKLAEAHSECMTMFIKAIVSGESMVIVDNTNLDYWERRNYILIAKSQDYEVEEHHFPIATIRELKICAARNQHGVPVGVIADMAMRHAYGIHDDRTCFIHKVRGR